jgi:hypothetical protein
MKTHCHRCDKDIEDRGKKATSCRFKVNTLLCQEDAHKLNMLLTEFFEKK